MFCQPIFAIPKKGGTNEKKFRLVNDHSAGSPSINSLIPLEGGSVHLDNLIDLACCLRVAISHAGCIPAYLFKSDASQAYRRIPMHPLWQARQPVRFDGLLHVDRNAVFGNQASGKLWCTFFALVGWAAVHKHGVEDLHQYVDNNFGFDFEQQLVYYPPYKISYPKKQVLLLELCIRSVSSLLTTHTEICCSAFYFRRSEYIKQR